MPGSDSPADAADYGPAQFQQEFGLSDAIMARMEAYVALLLKWQPRINLIGPNTVSTLWWRHMRDSAQLAAHLPEAINGPWLDIGSGAGFPGLVMSLMPSPHMPLRVHLVESDQRKAVFLQEVIRACSAPAQVHSVRIESLHSLFKQKAGLITARALARLHTLFEITEQITDSSTLFLLLKGQDVVGELTSAAKYRRMSVNQYPSRTNPGSMVLRITEVARV
ncbi:MAG: 16S rRNA (guanine527-N7)-methyltransferase [Alphaproteobacteria bacterium]|nr:16S rRNA (guanine527-N7)-methyltransferase [Alphaproteobacteria bacterium]